MSDSDFPSEIINNPGTAKNIQTTLVYEIQLVQRLLKNPNIPRYCIMGEKMWLWLTDNDNTYYFAEDKSFTKTFYIQENMCKKRKCSFQEMKEFISQLPEVQRMY